MSDNPTQWERELFRDILSKLTDLGMGRDRQMSPASQSALNACINILAEREAELIKKAVAPAGPAQPTGGWSCMEAQPERRRAGRKTMAHIPLLRGVGPEILGRVHEKSSFRDLGPDELLLAVGHNNENLYFILSGGVRVHLDEMTGPPYIVLGIGECVGEISTLGRTQTTAYVVGNEPSRLMVIDQGLLWDLIDDSPELARNLLYTLSHRLRRDNHFLRRSMRRQREFERNANLDALTGLNNRRGLNELFAARIEECAAQQAPLSVLMLDVDHFKRFNDTHGHLLGDAALCAIAGVLAEHAGDGIAARYGGEEFAVVLPGLQLAQARERAERIRDKIREVRLQSAAGELLPPITISVGAAQMRVGDTPQTLTLAADTALYCAKRKGRDCVVTHDAVSVETFGLGPNP
jgi:diguanylate cyclase (GGDEF)-like protein